MRREGTGVGRLVGDKYQVIESLGKGGMSQVWLVRDQRLGKLWAIKEIGPNAGGSHGEVLRQAIIDEANFMKRLDHPAIPRVVDIMDAGDTAFVVMDYVEGRELNLVLRERGCPFAQEEVIGWGIQLCDVLGYLHQLEPAIVYRDMKPSNVMLRDDGTVKLVDFGIAMECVPGRANDGRLVGTPGYAPPEQIPQPMPWPPPKSLDPDVTIDARADVYALGTTLYSLVTGHVPKRVRDREGHEQVDFDLRPIREWDPRLSEGLERILVRATQRDPELRYQNMAQMRYDLEHYRELTQEWRDAQTQKMRSYHRLLASTLSCLALGALLIGLGMRMRSSSYESCLRLAQSASRDSAGGEPSEAEQLLLRAIDIDAGRIEPFRELLEVYESDFRLTQEEDRRWRRAYAKAHDLERSEHFAQLCFDAGAAYLSYYGIELSGGSVGNACVASIDAAAPWFARALLACGEGDGPDAGSDSGAGPSADGQLIDDADVRAARVYGVIASFYQAVTRAGREGKGATGEYRQFWDALAGSIAEQNAAVGADKCAEGVRVRLCQVAVEALCSTTYLRGFSRAGVAQQEAEALLGEVRACMRDLGDFAEASEYQEVYGPVLVEIDGGMGIAQTNIQNVYQNPVAQMGQVPDDGRGGESA